LALSLKQRWLYINVLFFCCFVFNCYAYSLLPYSEKAVSVSNSSLNLIFLSLGYQDKEAFLEDVDVLMSGLSRIPPLDEFIENISVYYLFFPGQGQGVAVRERENFPPLRVRQDFLDNISGQIKSDYKLVIIDSDGSVSCAELSAAGEKSLIILGKKRYKNKDSLVKGFLHELGHSLGLRDECINCAGLCPPGPPNCAVSREQAEEWWGDLAGDFPEVNYIRGCCGNKDYIRPTAVSLMNDTDKAESFGPVNEQYLRQALERVKDSLD
jgi:hypothetical protein